jgi:hypothetical protein
MNQNQQIGAFFMLHFHTKILEACNWDEELTNSCIALLDYELHVAQRAELRSIQSILSHISTGLLEAHPAAIVDTVLEVLEESLQSAHFLIDTQPKTTTQYEN